MNRIAMAAMILLGWILALAGIPLCMLAVHELSAECHQSSFPAATNATNVMDATRREADVIINGTISNEAHRLPTGIKAISLDLIPTAVRLEAARQHGKRRRHRRRLRHQQKPDVSFNASNNAYAQRNNATQRDSEDHVLRHMTIPKRWQHPNLNGIYSTLSTMPNDERRQWDEYRHLSRYEIRYRKRNGMDLQSFWGGVYSHDYSNALHANMTINATTNVATNVATGGSSSGSSNSTSTSAEEHGDHDGGHDHDDGDGDGDGTDSDIDTRKLPDQGGATPQRAAPESQHSSDPPPQSRRALSHSSWLKSLAGKTQRSSPIVYQGRHQYDNYQAVTLSQGYGTHYANLWVGSPTPQRQSVIIDTGSHFTAFPCTGCDTCGNNHADSYFDPSRSSTFHALNCSECIPPITNRCMGTRTHTYTRARTNEASRMEDNGAVNECQFQQSYTEGSSWYAYQARDMVYVGGQDVLEAAQTNDQSRRINFMFGCLKQSKGLFVTQLASGIMGMSAHKFNIARRLWKAGKLENSIFALCFRKEFGTSKRGVTAGIMTLGGVSSTLDTSPMIYARNARAHGWFTVHVKAMFIAKGGGFEFKFDGQSPNELNRIAKVPLHLDVINAGKGTIVDSGTTDTYLSIEAADAFSRAWEEAVGSQYHHNPIRLTDEQIQALPTVLIQCESPGRMNGVGAQNLVGQVGQLDPASPNDLLIAIPATSYMEYSVPLDMYHSRLFFTESVGSVLGANAMQGHNVLFDWNSYRIGFAHSSCAYDTAAQNKTQKLSKISEQFDEDCRFVNNAPILTKSCYESTDIRICQESDTPSNVALVGTEEWTRLIDTPGIAEGRSCQDLAAELTTKAGEPHQYYLDPSEVTCEGSGICTEHRKCEISCDEALRIHHRSQDGSIHSDAERRADVDDICETDRWSGCDYSCEQTRLSSALDALPHVLDGGSANNGNTQEYVAGSSNGTCREISRDVRPCHVKACSRLDTCRVPFLVHAILGFDDFQATQWDHRVTEQLANSIVAAVHTDEFVQNDEPRLFGAGDVDVIAILPWPLAPVSQEGSGGVGVNAEASSEEGTKVVVQISIFNTKVKIKSEGRGKGTNMGMGESGVHPPPAHGTAKTSQRSDPNRRGGRKLLHSDNPPSVTEDAWNQKDGAVLSAATEARCNIDDLYPLAMTAERVSNDILQSDSFMRKLLEKMNQEGDLIRSSKQMHVDVPKGGKRDTNPGVVFSRGEMLAAWTVGTEVYEDHINLVGPGFFSPYALMFLWLYGACSIMLLASTISFLYQTGKEYAHPAKILVHTCWIKLVTFRGQFRRRNVFTARGRSNAADRNPQNASVGMDRDDDDDDDVGGSSGETMPFLGSSTNSSWQQRDPMIPSIELAPRSNSLSNSHHRSAALTKRR